MNEITPTKSKQPSHVPIDFPTGSGFLNLEWINEGHPLVNRTGRTFCHWGEVTVLGATARVAPTISDDIVGAGLAPAPIAPAPISDFLIRKEL